ncbi:MAG: class A beta-lactamase, subclass A2 [Bacteroides sp.]|nr:class A beta-lactamase, subclass A2 [Bacteroides sp.]
MIKLGKTCIIVSGIVLMGLVAWGLMPLSSETGKKERSYTDVLTDTIAQIVAGYPGEIGVAVIINGSDTVAVNNENIYPMMSVFKVHQALAVCHQFDLDGLSLDTLMTIKRDELDAHTWSPMLKDHQEPVMTLPVGDLLRYTLQQSDNNASNLMFEKLVGVPETDRFIATLIPRASFRIAYTESEMAADHAKAYSNCTSPLGAAMLMERLFTDSLVSREKQAFIRKALGECATGKDRIAAPLIGKEGVSLAHKTGSGYMKEGGILVAHNDVGYVSLPDGMHYTLAVFVKDFKGNEAQAAQAIARISECVYSLLAQEDFGTGI